MELDKARVMRIIKAAIKEDVGKGDITTTAFIPKWKSSEARIIAKEESVLCGINIAEWVFSAVDYSVRFKPQAEDGQKVYPGEFVAFVEGHARAILTAERVALNFISLLSGIATETRKYVEKCAKYNVSVLDTRKTFPLLRYLEKYAVSVGGGKNHRMDLGDMVMIKDNHLKAQDSKPDIKAFRQKVQTNVKIEVEVDTIDQYKKVLIEKPDIIMLDNMSPEDVREAIRLRAERSLTEAVVLEVSGGINLNNVEEYAKTGVDTISIGALTHSVKSADFSLDII